MRGRRADLSRTVLNDYSLIIDQLLEKLTYE
jgi:hypothetical protein